MKVAIYVHNPNGDMGEGTIIGPFSSWEGAERFRDHNYPVEGALEAIIVPMVGPRSMKAHNLTGTYLD